MALDIVILSVLRGSPMHGYELKRRVQRTSLTSLSNNSLYPILRRFEAGGAVTKAVEQQDGKPARNVYTITELGREHFIELISTLPAALAASEEEFTVRVSFFHELTPTQRRAILAARAAVLDEGIAQVEALRQESSKPWRTLAMTHVIDQRAAERRWIDHLTAKADE